jgi:biotin carboxylase
MNSEVKIKKAPAVVFVGFRHKTDSVQSAKNAGYKTILVTTEATLRAQELFDEIYELDMKNAESILAMIPKIKEKYRVRGVLTNYEAFVVIRSYIAEHLGVPTTSVYAASCTRNKALQRHALEFLPENIPAKRVKNVREAKRAFKELGGDCFVKNISGVKSKLIFHVESEEEVKEAIDSMKNVSKIPDKDLYDAYEFMKFHFTYPNPNETFLIEKTANGSLVSVDSIVGSRKIWHCPSLVDTITARELGMKDSFLAYRLLPSRLKPELIKKIKKVVSGAIRILGLKNCAVHTELMITKEGEVHLIELASRMGGYRQDMYMHAYNLDLSERLVRAVIGKEIKTRKKHNKVVAMIECFPSKEGKYLNYSGWDPSELPEGIELIYIKDCPVGREVGPAKLGFSPPVKLMLTGSSYKSLNEVCIQIQTELIVSTD